MIRVRTVVIAGLAGCIAASSSWAGRGSVELTLDKPAVAALLAASLPEQRDVVIPGGAKVTLEMSGADRVQFVDGGMESLLDIRVKEFGLTGQIDVRYEPRVDPETGKVQFVPVRTKPTGALAIVPDMSGLLSPLDLPRGFQWLLSPDGRSHHQLDVHVQGVKVSESKITIEIGLSTKPVPPPQGGDASSNGGGNK